MSGPLDAYDDTRPNNTTDDAGQLPETLRNIKTKLIDHRDRIVDLETDTASITSGLAAATAMLTSAVARLSRETEWTRADYLLVTNNDNLIPNDDTLPAVTEGNEIFSENYSASSVSAKLRFRTLIVGSSGSSGTLTIAMFQGTTCVQVARAAVNGGAIVELSAPFLTIGSTDPIEYQVRVSCASANFHLNGGSSGRLFGGGQFTRMTIEEYVPPA